MSGIIKKYYFNRDYNINIPKYIKGEYIFLKINYQLFGHMSHQAFKFGHEWQCPSYQIGN